MKLENKFPLTLDLQFFSSDDDNQGDNGSNNEPDNNKGNASDDSKKTDNAIPYERFQSVIQEKNEMKKQLDEFVKQQEKQKEETKKKQGEYEELYTELKSKHEPLEKTFNQYKETFKEMLKTKKQSIPEEYQSLIPNGDELQQLKWIEEANAKGLFEKKKVEDFGNKGANPLHKDAKPQNLAEALALKFKN